MVEEIPGCLVDPVHVLHHQEHGAVEHGVEEVDDEVVDAGAAELRVDSVGLRGGSDLGSERHGEQREHRQQVGSPLLHGFGEQCAGLGWVGVEVDPRPDAQQRAEHAVRRGSAVRGTRTLEYPQALSDGPCRVEESRLTHAGATREDHHFTQLADGVSEDVELALPTDEPGVARVASHLVSGGADLVGDDRLGLALDQERFEFLGHVHGAGAANHGCDRHDVSVGGLSQHAGGGVHRITHERVRPPERAPEESGEHATCLHALSEDERRIDSGQLER